MILPATSQSVSVRSAASLLLRRYLPVICCVAILLQLQSRSAWSEISQDAQPIVDRVVSTQTSDYEAWSIAVGEGVADYVRADNAELASWDMSFRRHGRQLWAEYRLRDQVSDTPSHRDFDIVRLIADGKVYVSAFFSPRIHPGGCEAKCRSDDQTNYSIASRGPRVDPRLYLLPPVLRKGDVTLYRSSQVTVEKESEVAQRATLRILFESGAYWRVEVAKDLDYRIVRAELGEERDPDTPSQILEYRWENRDGGIVPAEIAVKLYDYTNRAGYHVHRILLSELTRTLKSGEDDFSLEALELCAEARLIDYRTNGQFDVRDIEPSEPTVSDASGSIADSVDELPKRHHQQVNSEPIATQTDNTMWYIVLGLNIIVASAFCCTWLWRRH